MPDVLLQPEEFIVALRRIGAERYHDRHPFHRLLHDGHCTMAQVRAWGLNRLYYQSRIPLQDADLIARAEEPAPRRSDAHTAETPAPNAPVVCRFSPDHKKI